MPGEGLYAALLAFQSEMPTLPKDKVNPHFKSRYTPLDTVVEVAAPILARHKLVWTTKPAVLDGEPSLKFKLVHAPSGETDEGEMRLLLPKSDPQGQGSAITYARRYAMQCVLGIVADEDVDGNMAPAAKPAKALPVTGTLKPATLTPAQVTNLSKKLDGVDPKKVQLALAARGVNDLPALTYPQAREMLSELTA